MKFQIINLLFSFLPLLSFFSCAQAQTKKVIEKETLETITEIKEVTSKPGESFTDERDGTVYSTIIIGNQTWMAENLRYEIEGSMLNPDIPEKVYGRLYFFDAAIKACPKGWHLPMDREWDALEIAHGMPESFVGKGGWRGEHAVNLKSTTEWGEDGNGTNSLGFNVRPAGYYFSEEMGVLGDVEDGSRRGAFYV